MGLDGRMAFGRLMMMACPLLEDEMLYNLTTDPDEKRIFLLTNKNIRDPHPQAQDEEHRVRRKSPRMDFFNEDAECAERGVQHHHLDDEPRPAL